MKPSKAQEEFFKDTTIRDENGELLKVYHGTPMKFAAFSGLETDKNRIACGEGFNFTSSYETAKACSGINGRVIEAYMNIAKPLSADRFTLTDKDIDYLLKRFQQYEINIPKIREEINRYIEENKGTFEESDVWLLETIKDSIREDIFRGTGNFDKFFWDNIKDIMELNKEDENDLENGDAAETLLKIRFQEAVEKGLGYDGFTGHYLDGAKMFSCFQPNQIKATSNRNPTLSNDMYEKNTKNFER